MCINGGEEARMRAHIPHILAVSAVALAIGLPVSVNAGSRAAREKLAWMFTFAVKCPELRPDFKVLQQFVVREKIDFTEDSSEMVAIRKIGRRQDASLRGMSKAKICAMARARLGVRGSDIRGLLR
jgi:hypothetical protein